MILLWNTAPRAAIPVATPAIRIVLLIPEAMPDRAAGTTPSAVEAIDGLESPMPMPLTMNPASRVVHSESGLAPRISSNPTPTSVSPIVSGTRAGTFATRLRVTSGTMNANRVSGRKRTPASSGVIPITLCM